MKWFSSAIALSLALCFVSSIPAQAARRTHGFRLSHDPIHYGHARKREMARYSERHYGHHTWRLRHKRVIVLHFTGGTSWRSAYNTFASNTPDRGELPGVCAHYIVDRHGTVHQLVSLKVRCRHTIGLNHRSIGVEMVQPATHGSHWADRRILRRHRQIRAALHLVKYLKHRFHIKVRNVIGHAMANHNHLFKDLEGWRNDHTDWLYRDVRTFRHRLRRI
jgi:N-acetyl-anhydromuramyl-L-alanine amidase AmpD